MKLFGVSVASLGLSGDCSVWCSLDLAIGTDSGAPGGSHSRCQQGFTYRGTDGEICGGSNNWGATDVEVWYPR